MSLAESQRRREALQKFIDTHELKVSPWAEKANVSEGAIRNFLKGVSKSLRIDTYEALAAAAGVMVSDLTGEMPPPGTRPSHKPPQATESTKAERLDLVAYELVEGIIEKLGLTPSREQRTKAFEKATEFVRDLAERSDSTK